MRCGRVLILVYKYITPLSNSIFFSVCEDFCNIYENVMPDNDIVLEIKYDSYIPSRILHLLTDISTVQESVSKYIICSDRLRERLY